MVQSRRPDRTWYLSAGFLVVLVLAVLLVSRQPFAGPLDFAVRVPALLGYQAVFAASLSSAYLRDMLRLFGRPFLTVHQYVAVTGLFLLTVHPISVAVRMSTVNVFVPVVSSLRGFLQWGGRPAWYLLLIASAAALWRRSVGDAWRPLHTLTYIAFWLATAHAIMMGPNVQGPVTRALAVAMALAMVGVLVRKRMQEAARKRRRA